MLSPPRTSIFLFNGTRDYPVPLIDVHCNKVILCTIYRVTNRFYALLSHYLFHVLAATMYVLCWSGTIKPQSLLVHLLDKLGANIQLILVGPPTLGQPYFVGIQGFELDCRTLHAIIYAYFRRSNPGTIVHIQVSRRISFNAICAQLMGHTHIITWGLSPEEFTGA